jgi:hypothetical protein
MEHKSRKKILVPLFQIDVPQWSPFNITVFSNRTYLLVYVSKLIK